MGRRVSLDFHFNSPIEKVWFALTDSATLAKWMIFTNDFKAEVGHRCQFRHEPYGEWDGIVEVEVLEVQALHRLAYTWVSAGENNTVTWTLLAGAGGTTEVHLEQAGISQDAALEGARYGWQAMLSQLEKVLRDEDSH